MADRIRPTPKNHADNCTQIHYFLPCSSNSSKSSKSTVLSPVGPMVMGDSRGGVGCEFPWPAGGSFGSARRLSLFQHLFHELFSREPPFYTYRPGTAPGLFRPQPGHPPQVPPQDRVQGAAFFFSPWGRLRSSAVPNSPSGPADITMKAYPWSSEYSILKKIAPSILDRMPHR